MSYDVNAYMLKRLLPSGAELRARMARTGSRVVFVGIEDLTTVNGFVAVALDGEKTGFEMYCREITERRRSVLARLRGDAEIQPESLDEIFTACDFHVSLHCGLADEREQTAARILAMAIAACGNGWFSDPQTPETIRYAPRPKK